MLNGKVKILQMIFVDAVTGATPINNSSHIEILDSLKLAQGKYNFCIKTSYEVESSEDIQSTFYRGEINFAESENKSTPSSVHSKPDLVESNVVLTNVVGIFKK